MNDIYPIAKLGGEFLVISRGDLKYIGTEKSMEVKCVKVDLKNGHIDEPIEIEVHLKFNPWEEIINEDERNIIISKIANKFTETQINEKISEPLAENRLYTDENHEQMK